MAQFIVEEEFYRATDYADRSVGFGAPGILVCGTDEQKRYYLPACSGGNSRSPKDTRSPGAARSGRYQMPRDPDRRKIVISGRRSTSRCPYGDAYLPDGAYGSAVEAPSRAFDIAGPDG